MICQISFLVTDDKEKDQAPALLDNLPKILQPPFGGQEKTSQYIKTSGQGFKKLFTIILVLGATVHHQGFP